MLYAVLRFLLHLTTTYVWRRRGWRGQVAATAEPADWWPGVHPSSLCIFMRMYFGIASSTVCLGQGSRLFSIRHLHPMRWYLADDEVPVARQHPGTSTNQQEPTDHDAEADPDADEHDHGPVRP